MMRISLWSWSLDLWPWPREILHHFFLTALGHVYKKALMSMSNNQKLVNPGYILLQGYYVRWMRGTLICDKSTINPILQHQLDSHECFTGMGINVEKCKHNIVKAFNLMQFFDFLIFYWGLCNMSNYGIKELWNEGNYVLIPKSIKPIIMSTSWTHNPIPSQHMSFSCVFLTTSFAI